MKNNTALDIDLACYHAVHNYPGGVPAVAATYGWTASTLQNKLNPTQNTHKLMASEAAAILALTKDGRILDAMCAQLPGAVWLNMGTVDGLASDMAMLENITQLITRVGELSRKVQESLEDGRVDDDELRELENKAFRATQAVFYVIERAKQFR